jgi:hypothetical protein
VTPEEEEIARIDARIRFQAKRTRAMGTVVSRATSGPAAMVRLDSADTPIPVLCPGSVFCQPGDWVTVDLYGTQWVITNSFTGPGFGEASKFLIGLPLTTGALSSASYLDLSEFPAFSFTKFFDNTFVAIKASYSAYVTTGNTEVEWAVRLAQTSGDTPYASADISMSGIFFNNATEHLSKSMEKRMLGIPAGTYTVTLRWRRAGGSGTAIANADDGYSVELDERVRAGAPVL